MADNGSGSGQIAWCTSGAVAVAAHILLLCSMPAANIGPASRAVDAIEWTFAPQQAPASMQQASAASAALGAAPLPIIDKPHVRSASRKKTPRARAPAATVGESHARSAAAASDRTDAKPSPDELSTRSELAAESGEASTRDDEVSALGRLAKDRSDPPALNRLPAADSVTSGRAAVSGDVSNPSHPLGPTAVRGPRLLATRDPCAGYFPGSAAVDLGRVQLALEVDAQGHAHAREILLESPRGQGFESAAKACASQLHFAPALDVQGRPISGRARIALRFERS